MKAKKRIQSLCIGKKVMTSGTRAMVVNTSDISVAERTWDGKLVSLRELRDGKTQVVRLG